MPSRCPLVSCPTMQAGQPATAAPLLNAAYEALSQVDVESEEAGGGLGGGALGSGLAAEVQGVGAQVGAAAQRRWHECHRDRRVSATTWVLMRAQVLTLLAWCGVEMGEAERGLSCLQVGNCAAG